MRMFCATLILTFFACSAFAVDDVAGAVTATVKSVDRGAKTAVVKTKDGTEETIHFVGRTTTHGAEATAKGTKDAFLNGEGRRRSDRALRTEKAGVKTADEVDHVGKEGMKGTEVAVKSVDHAAKTVTVKTAEGAEETLHVTDRALKETGKGLDKGGKATVYYTEDAGKKVVHFFKEN